MDAAELIAKQRDLLNRYSYAIEAFESRFGGRQPTVMFSRRSDRAVNPSRATAGSAGFDLHAPYDTVLHQHTHLTIDLELSAAIPEGWCGIIMPRSGKSVKFNYDINAGLIDSDFRDSINVCLSHKGSDSGAWTISRGDRIAQMVVLPFLAEAIEVDELPDPKTRDGGFGSTGR